MPHRRRWLLFGVLVAAGILLDQGSKALARAYLTDRPPLTLLSGLVRLEYAENPGAFLGLGASLPPELRVLLFGVFASLLLVGMILYLLTTPEISSPELIAGSLVVSGGLGNLIDRALYQGRVIDFLHFDFGLVRTGILNVADLAITFGALWLLLASLHRERQSPKDEAT